MTEETVLASGDSWGQSRVVNSGRLVVVAVAAAVLIALGLTCGAARRHVRATGLLLRFLERGDGLVGWLARFDTRPVTRHEERRSTSLGAVRVLRFEPEDRPDAPTVLLLHGVHHLGPDEPRLVHFARALAASGLAVVVPELELLASYEFDPATVTKIGELANGLASERNRKVGLVGISFAGGLALIASGDERFRDAIAFIFAVGAHHDLVRVANYWLGEPVHGPDGRSPKVPPHPYGAALLVYAFADRLFDPEDVAPARRIFRAMLVGRQGSVADWMGGLSQAGRDRMSRLLEFRRQGSYDRRETKRVLDLLRKEAERFAALSPHGHLSQVAVPVFLVHGDRDPVIPSIETRWLAHDLPSEVLEGAVVTSLLRHAEAQGTPSAGETWDVILLVARILAEAEHHGSL